MGVLTYSNASLSFVGSGKVALCGTLVEDQDRDAPKIKTGSGSTRNKVPISEEPIASPHPPPPPQHGQVVSEVCNSSVWAV